MPDNAPKRTTREWLGIFLSLFLIVGSSGLAGGLAGYSIATGGQIPWARTTAIVPPVAQTETTMDDVGLFLESTPRVDVEYGDSFNCVEDAILMVRSAHWAGLSAEPARLMFADYTGHLILAFPTDDGYIFADPQTRDFITPVVGGHYFGKTIISIDRLVSYWDPFDWEVK